MTEDRAQEKVKVVLLGEIGVGKTALFLRFAEDTFFETMPPIEDPVKARQFPIDDTRVKIEVGDTAGDEAFRTTTTSHFRGANGVALVLDLSKADALKEIEKWNYECDRSMRQGSAKVLIGTKSDLPAAISREDVEKWASERNMKFFTCSAKTGEGVMEPFIYIAREILRDSLQNNTPSSPKKSLHVVGTAGGPTKKTGCSIL